MNVQLQLLGLDTDLSFGLVCVRLAFEQKLVLQG